MASALSTQDQSILRVNITDTNNSIGGYSIMVFPAQHAESNCSDTCMCTPTHRHSLCTVPPLHSSTTLTSSVTSCIESMRPFMSAHEKLALWHHSHTTIRHYGLISKDRILMLRHAVKCHIYIGIK